MPVEEPCRSPRHGGLLRRDKDRTKTQEDRYVELCPRALEVLKRHLALRDEYVASGKITHEHLFFLEDGRPISDPEITRWRWSESIKALGIRRRGALPRAPFLGDLAAHAGKESAVGCEAARPQRRSDAAHVRRVARRRNRLRYSRDQTGDGTKTRRARRNSRSTRCNFRCKSSAKSHEVDRDSSPEVPRIWQ